MSKVIDLPRAAELLKLAVEERGADFVYAPPGGPGSRCFYWHTDADTPGCIVGYALHAAGVSKEALEEWGSSSADSLSNPGDGVEVWWSARMLFQTVQGRQDHGMPWGEAVRRTLEDYAGESPDPTRD